ncbi:hypothetical protein GCM10023321_36790 [Pseudonocardia eucalypti]|uniref:Bulb-type lectin domain-containing protein n=1 Tax=Pseudonocardia eucalypti TaxID=648755 RepID=A0ABP9Q717_9PSEU|nr:hypothetical protein [Pseudonocardia eucalypti]
MLAKVLLTAALALSPVVAVPAVASAVPAGVLASGATLGPNQSVRSGNGRYTLIQQTDGNLVFYDSARRALWSSQTTGKGARTVMQGDGNLVVVNAANQPVWHAGTAPNQGAWLGVQDDGNLVIYSSGKVPLWSRHMIIGRMDPNRTLAADQFVRSANQRYRFIMQRDGNLVLYKGAQALWNAQTTGKGGVKAVMQGDGNLVVVNAANQPVWNAGTAPNPGAWLGVQDDGNVVIYSTDKRALWSTKTGGR